MNVTFTQGRENDPCTVLGKPDGGADGDGGGDPGGGGGGGAAVSAGGGCDG